MGEIGRRTVLRAAWATPVVVAAAAAPAASASVETLTAFVVPPAGRARPIYVYATTPSSATPEKITIVITPLDDPDAGFSLSEPEAPGWVLSMSGNVAVVETVAPVAPGSTTPFWFSYVLPAAGVLAGITVQYPGYPDVELTAISYGGV